MIFPLYCQDIFLKLNDISALPQRTPAAQPAPEISKISTAAKTIILFPPKRQRAFFISFSGGGSSSIFSINCFLASDSFSALAQNDFPSLSSSSISSFIVSFGGLGAWLFTVSRFSSFARFNGIISDTKCEPAFFFGREPVAIPALSASSMISASSELIETVLPATSASLFISSKLESDSFISESRGTERMISSSSLSNIFSTMRGTKSFLFIDIFFMVLLNTNKYECTNHIIFTTLLK